LAVVACGAPAAPPAPVVNEATAPATAMFSALTISYDDRLVRAIHTNGEGEASTTTYVYDCR
jgi:hypothetical protein